MLGTARPCLLESVVIPTGMAITGSVVLSLAHVVFQTREVIKTDQSQHCWLLVLRQ